MQSLLIRIAIVLALLGGLVGSGYWMKHTVDSARKEAAKARAQVAKLNAQLAFEYITSKVVTQYVDRVREVRVKGDTIIKEIPVYVTQEADAGCTVPVGFVRVHDAAVQNSPVAGAPGAADAEPAGIAISAVAGTVADNYATCHEVREQLIGLQGWVRSLRQ